MNDVDYKPYRPDDPVLPVQQLGCAVSPQAGERASAERHTASDFAKLNASATTTH